MDPEIKKLVLNVADTFQTTMNQFAQQQKMLNQSLYDLKKRERQLAADVANAKTPDGKDMFSSDVKRKAELASRLDIDAEYKRLNDVHGSAEDAIADTKTTIAICKFNMKAYDIITR